MSPDAYIEMAATEERHWWFCARRQILESVLTSLALPASAKILEIGSGTGGNLAMLQRFGKVSALEMDDTARAMAQKKMGAGCDIRAGHCPDAIPFEAEQFDLVCLFDVLEHIPDDVGTLAKLPGLLKPGGKVMITVPAYPWLWGAHDEYLHHQRRYSAKAFRQKLTRAGFKIEKFSYFNTLLFPLAALVRLKERLSGNQKALGGALPNMLVNGTLKAIFASERHLLRHANLPFGVSLLAVASHQTPKGP